MRKLIACVIIFAGLILDQLLKSWIVLHISLGQVHHFIPGILSLTHQTNSGAAWSSLEGQRWFFLILTPIVIAVAGVFLWQKIQQNGYLLGLSLIISGALGNFVDRVHQGYVVDMFQTDFINFPIFNLADLLLTVGFVALFIAIIRDGN